MVKKDKVNYKLIAVITALFVFSIWVWTLRPIETKTVDVEFSVDRNPGITVDSDKLYFGRMTPGGDAERKVILENTAEYPMKVTIHSTKNIIDYVIIYESYYIIPQGEKIEIPIAIKVPQDMPYGNYSGQLKFELRKI